MLTAISTRLLLCLWFVVCGCIAARVGHGRREDVPASAKIRRDDGPSVPVDHLAQIHVRLGGLGFEPAS